MKFGETILTIFTGAYALTKIIVKMYNWTLGFLQRRAEGKNPAAAALLKEERRPLEAFKAKLEEQLSATGAAVINVSADQKMTIAQSQHNTHLVTMHVGGFLHRHPSFVYAGFSFMHTLLYFFARRFFSQDPTPVDSLREAVAAPALMLGVATYENIRTAYSNTLEYAQNRAKLDEKVNHLNSSTPPKMKNI